MKVHNAHLTEVFKTYTNPAQGDLEAEHLALVADNVLKAIEASDNGEVLTATRSMAVAVDLVEAQQSQAGVQHPEQFIRGMRLVMRSLMVETASQMKIATEF